MEMVVEVEVVVVGLAQLAALLELPRLLRGVLRGVLRLLVCGVRWLLLRGLVRGAAATAALASAGAAGARRLLVRRLLRGRGGFWCAGCCARCGGDGGWCAGCGGGWCAGCGSGWCAALHPGPLKR